MLKGLDPLLHAGLLGALRSMGHGDMIAVTDANFPAESIARHTALGHALRLDGVDAPRAARAILSVLPLDTFVTDAAARMQVVDEPDTVPDVQRAVQAEVDAAEGRSWPLVGVERFAFYERAKSCQAVVVTGERRFYGCFTFTMGVLPPDPAGYPAPGARP